jgi:hypothetical protein
MMAMVQVIQHLFREMIATYAQVTKQVGILPKALNMISLSKGKG